MIVRSYRQGQGHQQYTALGLTTYLLVTVADILHEDKYSRVFFSSASFYPLLYSFLGPCILAGSRL